MTRILNSHRFVLLALGLVALAWLWTQGDRGWIPHDEGTLAHAAERVRAGELPHRDWDEPYTGGLAFLHAAAFELFGVRLLSMRIMLGIACLAFVPAVYLIAARFAPPPVAGAVTLLCLTWSFPNYFAGVPSWYNLVFGVLGALALLRHVDTGRARWLVAAGVCAGLSFLVKLTGVYFVAAALLLLVFREQTLTRDDGTRGPGRGFGIVVSAGVLAFVAVLGALVLRRPTFMDAAHFLLPGVALAVVLWWGAWELRGTAGGPRYRRLVGLGAPFLLGAAVPVAAFLVPYALSGSLDAWVHGVFVLPQRRFDQAGTPLPPAWTLLTALPLAVLLVAPLRRGDFPGEAWLVVPVGLVAVAALSLGDRITAYRMVWHSVRPAIPLATMVGCVLLVRGGPGPPPSSSRRQELYLLLGLAAMLGLVQIPFSSAIYFCYAAPAAILAVAAVALTQAGAPKRLHAVALGFYALFAMTWLNRGYTYALGDRYEPVVQDTRLDLPRGGLRIAEPWAIVYERMHRLVQGRSAPGAFIYAAPDSPEVYFLTGRRNPTRTIFDFFDADFAGPPGARAARILDTLEARDVDCIVLRKVSEFSPPPPPGLMRRLRERYPREVAGELFDVRWREASR